MRSAALYAATSTMGNQDPRCQLVDVSEVVRPGNVERHVKKTAKTESDSSAAAASALSADGAAWLGVGDGDSSYLSTGVWSVFLGVRGSVGGAHRQEGEADGDAPRVVPSPRIQVMSGPPSARYISQC